MDTKQEKVKTQIFKDPFMEGTVLHQYVTAKELAGLLRKSSSYLYQLESEHPGLCTPAGKLHRSRIYHPRQAEIILMCYESAMALRDDRDNWEFGEQLWRHYKNERFQRVTTSVFEVFKHKGHLHLKDERPTRANLTEYRNFIAEILYNPKRDCLQGQVLGIDDEVIFCGDRVAEMHHKLREFVKGYIKSCKEKEIKPQRSFSGELFIRIGSARHRRLLLLARKQGRPVADIVNEMIDASLPPESEDLPTGKLKVT